MDDADTGDYFSIATTAAGATTITTVDDGGAEADIIFAPDGVIRINDDTKLTFGNGEDASIEYDEDGTDKLSIVGAAGGTIHTGQLELTQGSTGGFTGVLVVDNDDTDKVAIVVEAANIDADVIDITADAVTTANVIDITADGLTTGTALNIVSDSSDTSDRTLVFIHNDNTAATGVQMMHLKNDAIGGSGDPILLIESTANETDTVLELRNSFDGTASDPILRFSKTANSDDDNRLGMIEFNGLYNYPAPGSPSGITVAYIDAILQESTNIATGQMDFYIRSATPFAGTTRLQPVVLMPQTTKTGLPFLMILMERHLKILYQMESLAVPRY